MFEKIYSSAKGSATLNKETKAKKDLEVKAYEETATKEERIRNEVEKSDWKIIEGTPDYSEVVSDELLDIIKRQGFNIKEYARRMSEIDYTEYNPTLEYYSLTYNNYKFIVKNFSDPDIEEGIFAIYEVEHVKTGEIITYYLDIGCRNTTKLKLENFMMLLSCESEEEFLDKKYVIYKKLPELLKNKGYNVEDNVTYFTDNIKGYLKIDNKLFIVPYIAWMNETRLVVTNYNQWSVNSSNSAQSIGYYVPYSGDDDIDILVDNIEAFKKHISGKYGYFENGKYYNNKDIEKIINISHRDKNGSYLECFNHYHIKIDTVRPWDSRGYGNPYINVYEGLEMAVHFNVIFNDAAQWSIGDMINLSDIVVKYDKKIDPDNCILLIRNYEYNRYDEDSFIYYQDPDDEDYEPEKIDSLHTTYNKENLIDEVEVRGTFSEVSTRLKEYLNGMCKIFDIDLTF